MTRSDYILTSADCPEWLVYPKSFRRLVEQSLINITPWHIMRRERAVALFSQLQQRYPSRILFPFAYRQDNDDVVCWEKGNGEVVLIIHDHSSPGYENEGSHVDVWSWFRAAIDETIDWD